MNKIKQNIKHLRSYDLFGYPISLSFKKKTSYKTVCGGFLSLLIIIFFISLCIYSMFRLFNKEYMETSKYLINLGKELGSLELNTNNFMLAVKFDSEILNNWSKSYINITLTQITQYRNITNIWKIRNKIKLIQCARSHFAGLETEFDQLQLKTALCPNFDSNLSIGGGFQEELFTYLSFSLTQCENEDYCQTNKKISDTIKNINKIRFQIYIINNNINELNFETPITRNIISDMHFLIDPLKEIYRTADIYLTETEVKTDSGYAPTIKDELLSMKNFTYLQEFREQTIFSSSNKEFAEFYFRKSQNKIKYERKLGNLLTIVSYLGGIWSSCYFLIFIFVYNYTKYSFITTLSNKIYNFPSQMKLKENINTNIEENLTKNTESPLSYEKKISFTNIILKIKEYLNYDRKLYLNPFQLTKLILISFFNCKPKDEKSVLFKKSEENLMKDLDIFNIIRRLHVLEKMKELLFNEDQQNIIDFSPKPPIQVNENIQSYNSVKNRLSNRKSLRRLVGKKKTFLLKQVKFDDINNFKNLINSWKKLKIDEENKEINKKLIEMLGEEFSFIIDINENDFNNYLADNEIFGKSLCRGLLMTARPKSIIEMKKQKSLEIEILDVKKENEENIDFNKN